jgi:hypothetical protein
MLEPHLQYGVGLRTRSEALVQAHATGIGMVR